MGNNAYFLYFCSLSFLVAIMADEKLLRIVKINEGTVIDHIRSSYALLILRALNIDFLKDNLITIGINVFSNSSHNNKKDIIKIENVFLNQKQINAVSLISPGAKISFIKNGIVDSKQILDVPDKITEILPCPNANCVSNKEREPIVPEFTKITVHPLKVQCDYCGRVITKETIIELIDKLAGKTLRNMHGPIVDND